MSRRIALAAGLSLAACVFGAPRTEPVDGFSLGRSLQPGTLVEPGFEAVSGSLSPDGETVAYVAPGDLRRKALFLKPAKGGAPRVLVDGNFDVGSPCWSPDGKWVYFHSDERGVEKIFRVRLEDAEREQITSGTGHDLHPSLSGDGRLLAYDSDREGGSYDIWVRDLEAGTETRLTLHPGADFYPAFHPDGTRVAFTSSRGGGWKIWAKPLAGGKAYPLSRGSGADNHAAASPDGKWVAFDSDREGGLGLFLASWKGGRAVKVELPAVRASYPSFSSKTELVYLSDLHGVTSLEVHELTPGFSGISLSSAEPARKTRRRRKDLAFAVPSEPETKAPAIPGRPPILQIEASGGDEEGELPASPADAVRVLSFHPPGGKEPIGADTPIYLTFSRAVKPVSSWQTAVRLHRKGAGEVPVQVEYNPGLRRVEVSPEAPLTGGTYRVSVRPGSVEGPGGESFRGFKWNFLSEGAGRGQPVANLEIIDQPIRIQAVKPKVNQKSVRPDTRVGVKFTRAFDPGTVSADALTLKSADGTSHAGEIRLGQGDRVLYLTPYEPLNPGVDYRVVVSRDLKDGAGDSLAGKNGWGFRVAHGSPLKVVKVEPEDRELARDTTLTLVFNRPVDPASMGGAEVVLEGGGLPYKGGLNWDSSRKILVFQPYSRLPARTEFTMVLPPGLADTDGNGLELDKPLRFRTGKEEATADDKALFARHLGGAGTGSTALARSGGETRSPGSYFKKSGGTGQVPDWVGKVLKVMGRKGYLDPALAGSLDSPVGLSRYKAALLVDSARDRQAAMTPYEKKLVGKLAKEFRPEMARLGRLDEGLSISPGTRIASGSLD